MTWPKRPAADRIDARGTTANRRIGPVDLTEMLNIAPGTMTLGRVSDTLPLLYP